MNTSLPSPKNTELSPTGRDLTLAIRDLIHSLGNPSLPIHLISNSVSSTLVANTVLALGHTPSMTEAEQEIKDAISSSHALLINIGTPHNQKIPLLKNAALIASQHHIPWILDPVMCNRFPSRLQLAASLLLHKPTIIRGNHQEIKTLACHLIPHLVNTSPDILALSLSQHLNTLIISTGQDDFIAHNQECLLSSLGHPLQHATTGMGCAMGALLACTLASSKNDPLLASLTATLMTGDAAIKAAQKTQGPGTFPHLWLDELYLIAIQGFPSLPPLHAITTP